MHVELELLFRSIWESHDRSRHPIARAACGVLAACGLATVAFGQSTQAEPESRKPEVTGDAGDSEVESRIRVAFGLDYTTAYFFRGFAYEDTGLIVQPSAALSLDIIRADVVTVSLEFQSWNSFHGQATDAGTDDDVRKYWFESDVVTGVGAEIGQLSLGLVYNWYTSPSDAFETTEEVMFTASYEDEELLPGGWTLQPEMTLAVETGSVANDGGRKGTYLELGVSPGHVFDAGHLKELDLRFPLRVGLSLSNYYEGENGENDAFGYASIGTELTVPLMFNASWGEWSVTAGVRGLFLGDAAATYNGNDDFQLIGTIGIAVEF